MSKNGTCLPINDEVLDKMMDQCLLATSCVIPSKLYAPSEMIWIKCVNTDVKDGRYTQELDRQSKNR